MQVGQVLGVQVMAERSQVVNAALRLLFLHQDCPIRFFPHSVQSDLRPERIGPWLLVAHLHPWWTEHVNSRGLSDIGLFNGVLPAWLLRVYGDPPLILADDLEHLGRFTFDVFVDDISVVRVVHHSHVGWDIRLVPSQLGAGVLRVKHGILLSLGCGVLVQVCVNILVVVVGFFIFADLKLLLEDELSLQRCLPLRQRRGEGIVHVGDAALSEVELLLVDHRSCPAYLPPVAHVELEHLLRVPGSLWRL